MPLLKVVVVGGGVAGVAAALAASGRGAQTTLIDSSNRIGLSRALMPFLISEGWDEDDLILPQAQSLSKSGVEVRTGMSVDLVLHQEKKILVSSALAKSEADRRSVSIGFDSLVICTGATSQPPHLRGLSKPNVFLLRAPSDYLGLSGALPSLQNFVVSGPIPLALKLGEILAAKGKGVRIYCGNGGLSRQFSEPVAAALRQQVSARGKDVALVDESIDGILGVKKAEAVSSGGSVQTCDGVVVIPKSVPSFPEVGCDKGREGGLLVDLSMSTSLLGVFAAGDSAEIKFKSGTLAARLHSTSLTGGQVAGLNAAGGRALAAPSWAAEQAYFGFEFCSAGLSKEEALAMGLKAGSSAGVSADYRFGESGGPRETHVSLVYDVATHQVYGVQVGGWRSSSLSAAASLIVSAGLTVEQLAHLESPYSPGLSYDASPIALTAGKILGLSGS